MTHPLICLALYGTTEEICNAIRSNDADLFEVRLDLSDRPDGTEMRSATSKPLIFTAHGQPGLIEKYWPFADYVDMKQEEATGQNTIVSIHTGHQDPELLWRKLRGQHIKKIVMETDDYETHAHLLELNEKHKPLALCFASGETGAFTRIASVLNGARWIYACLSGRPTGPGQFSIDQLIDTFRFRRFNTTRPVSIFGIVGNPVSHSLSPGIQNKNFADASLDWIYLPFECKDLASLFKHAPKWKSKGFSITHPYKEKVLSFLDSVSSEVERLRSCNTVAYVNGKWVGTNTDFEGITSLLQDVPIHGARVAVIGAGASARAFVSIMRPHVSDLLILNRDVRKAEKLALEFQAKSGSLQDLQKFDYDLLIQATPVGWNPGEMPVNAAHIRPRRIVIDSIYQDTDFLKKARDAGCTTVNGEKWFQVQAQAQFRWWKEVHK